MGLDRSLDQEGIPDLAGPLPEKAKTGDPQEGTPPPTERPASLDYGATAEEQSRPEPLDRRLARERPDFGEAGGIGDDEPMVLLESEDAPYMVAQAMDPEEQDLTAEEAAVHEVRDGM